MGQGGVAGRLQWIQSSAAGLDHCLVPSVVDSSIVVSSASGVLADQVAEHAIALTTGLTRPAGLFPRPAKTGFIRRPTRDLTHATVGIVGFGGNGRRLAEVFSVFKTRILATDMFPVAKPDYVEALWPADRLDQLLRSVDFLFLAAPLTELTRNMIDGRALGLMRPGSFLINVAADRWWSRPIWSRHWIRGTSPAPDSTSRQRSRCPRTAHSGSQPNVIITPHVGGQCSRRIDDMTDFFLRI